MHDTEQILQTGESSELVELGAIPYLAPIRERPIIAVLAGIHFIHIMDFMMLLPLGPQLMKLFELTPQEFSLLISIYAFSAGVFSFLASFIIDHYDRKSFLIFLCCGIGLATLLCALSFDYYLLLLARMVAGGFSGVLSATIFTIIADITPAHRRGNATGTVMSAFSAVAVIGMPFGMLLVNLFSWRAPFLFLTLLSIIMISLAVWLLPVLRDHLKHRQQRNPAQHLRTIFFNRNHLYAFALIAMLMFAGFSVSPFITTYMITNVGMSEVDVPYLYFFGGLATFYTARLFGKLSDQHSKHKIFSVAASLSVFPILMITHLTTTSVLLAIVVSTLFMMLVSGRFVPAMALVTASVNPRLRGSFLSFNIAIQQLSAGTASLLAGSIMSTTATGTIAHYDTVGIIAAVATVISILLALRVHALPE